MKWIGLPPTLILATSSYPTLTQGNPDTKTTPDTTAANGTGAAYATSCASAIWAYNSASSSWDNVHNTVERSTSPLGGVSATLVTYYENATTLCDGHPRVTYSPAIPISTGWISHTGPVTGTTVITATVGSMYPAPSPSCSIRPEDCDGLWSDYSQSLTATASITSAPQIQTPPCMNQSAAMSWSTVSEELYGCGPCTIYGQGVELVYFPVPTTVSRDMCASTPLANLTSYGPGAVITAYAGKSFGANATATTASQVTAVADGHTFTSGTAYISIAEVYAKDRCNRTVGTTVRDAILAMPSSSVLSLRYSQAHYQALLTTSAITGYPVQYADFNTPIPWSAWNGQNICYGPNDIYSCGVIYENQYRPQLAIPPEITSLQKQFQGCQMFYNGLWDPPLALTEVSSAATPTLPPGMALSTTAPAQPSPTAAVPISQPTAAQDNTPQSTGQNGLTLPNGHQTGTGLGSSGGSEPQSSNGGGGNNGASGQSSGNSENSTPSTDCVPSKEPWTKDFTIGGKQYKAEGKGRQAIIGTVTCDAGGPAQTLSDGTVCSYGDNGLQIEVKTTIAFGAPATITGPNGQIQTSPPGHGSNGGSLAQSGGTPGQYGGSPAQSGGSPIETGDVETVTLTINGQVETAVQEHDTRKVVINGNVTITPGGPAVLLSNGYVVSLPQDGHGIVVQYNSTLGAMATTTASGNGSISGAIMSGLGYGGDSSTTASSTTGSGQPTQTGGNAQPSQGVASKLLSFEGFNSVVVLFTVLALFVA